MIEPDVELAFVAECLRAPERFFARGLTPKHFAVPKHEAVITAALALLERGATVGVDTVALELQRQGLDGLCDGVRGVAALALGNRKMLDEERLRELHRLRIVRARALDAIGAAERADLAGALSALAGLEDLAASGTGGPRDLTEVVDALVATLEDPETFQARRVYLGMRSLDKAVGTLPVGAMLVLGADTNVGKSMYALGMLLGAAHANVKAGLISIEDPEDVTGSRALGMHTELTSSREILHGRFANREQSMRDIRAARDRMHHTLKGRLFLEDLRGQTEFEVCASMSRMAALGAKLVVVDYLQEIRCSERAQDRRNEVRYITQRLKAHAKRAGVALVLVSQIARPQGENENKCPSKHALKESGDITNSAEAIVMLWRPKGTDDVPVSARLVKCKWGGVGLTWEVRRRPDNGVLEEDGKIGMTE